jgi:mRNA-degrading endonuclease YafQ of YafQ-DinJ toxin-antitoxin module
MNSIKIRKSDLFSRSFTHYRNLIERKLKAFFEVKMSNPLQSFGASDKPFSSDGVFNKTIPGLKHAHLTQDISIVYRLSGKNPTLLDLYGIFSHQDLGTGQPPNRKVQKSMSQQFDNQVLETKLQSCVPSDINEIPKIWRYCAHDWKEVESMSSFINYRCTKCSCPGEGVEDFEGVKTGEVYWPTT